MDASGSNGLRPRERDSHDLSEQFARYSVVDSMLLSLAGIPTSPGAAPGTAPVALPSVFTPTPSSPTVSRTGSRADEIHDDDDDPYVVRDKTLHDSHASAIAHATLAKPNPNIDDTASRYAAYHATGRVNAPASTARIPQAQRERKRHIDVLPVSTPTDSDNASSDMMFQSRSKGHEKKASVGSTSGSIAPGPPRFHVPERGASSETTGQGHGLRATSKRAPRPPPIQSPDEIEAELMADAAPTPTIPGGPRRHQDTLGSATQSPVKGRHSRRSSVKSSRTIRKGKSHGQFEYSDNSEVTIRDQARQFVNATNTIRNAQSNSNLASVASSGAPSPAIGALRNKAAASPAVQAPVQKQGFFRRVFGGGTKQTREEDKHSHGTYQTSHTRPASAERPKTQPRTSGQFSRASRPPTQDAHGRSDHVGGPLRKSSSSFFRRRKRSTDHTFEVPPVPSLQHLYQPQDAASSAIRANTLPALRGSVDYSLQNVMAPYLSGSTHLQQPSTRVGGAQASSGFGALPGSQPNFDDPFGTSQEPYISEQTRVLRKNSAISDGILQELSSSSHLSLKPSFHDLDDSIDHNKQRLQKSLHNDISEARQLNKGRQGSLPVNSGTSSAQMPTRPAPVPAALSGSQPMLDVNAAVASMSSSPIDRTFLSPISDHSLRSPRSLHSLSSDNGTHGLDDCLDEDFILSQNAALHKRTAKAPKNSRVWLHPSESEESLPDTSPVLLPVRDAKHLDARSTASVAADSNASGYESATSVPALVVDQTHRGYDNDDEADATVMERKIAKQIFDGDETLVTKASAAAWLGRMDVKNIRTRRAYMDLYDWTGVSLLFAFRELCGRLILRAESQQLDRVIEAFSDRWCECNISHGFKGKDVVHTLVFAILMLNTDLHITDSEQRMTRTQFVKNTLPTLRSLALDPSGNEDTIKASKKHDRGNIPWDDQSTPLTPSFGPISERPSMDVSTRNRLSRLPLSRSEQESHSDSSSGDSCTLLVNAPFEGSMKNWEAQLETILKEFYNSIRSEMLPLHGNTSTADDEHRSQHNGSLSVAPSVMRRSPSVLSRAPSENVSFRGRAAELRTIGRFASKSRNRPRMYPSSTFTFGSSRTSLDDQSLWSPAASTFTKHSFSKTHTSMSVESLGMFHSHGGANPAIGFANAVSRKIIREESGPDRISSSGDSIDLEGRAVPFFENEDLELHGPPWAKEGILDHLSYMGINGKRAKERRPVQCFAVVAKGHMRLFSFTSHGSVATKSALRHLRHHKKGHGANTGGPVGGGNWADNAEELGSFILRQTWASTDNKSKSKDKPTWYMHMPTGEIHAFIVSSTELADEWTWTVNYWSARLSRQPLIGGVSSEEYGWSENLLSNGRPGSSATNATSPPATASSRPPSSMSRTSFDQGAAGGPRVRLPGDRTLLHEWRPPAFSTLSSQLMEVDQKTALEDFLVSLDEEFSKHSELRPLMTNAFSSRHPNAAKALTNWSRKANYLTGENVKYKTYIGALERAAVKKQEIEADKEAETAAQESAEVENAPVDPHTLAV